MPAAWIIRATMNGCEMVWPGLDRQRVVAIGEMGVVGADERFARDGEESVDDLLVADAAALQLPLDHRLALGGKSVMVASIVHLRS